MRKKLVVYSSSLENRTQILHSLNIYGFATSIIGTGDYIVAYNYFN